MQTQHRNLWLPSAAILLPLLLLGACVPKVKEEPPLETVEIGPSATDKLRPEGDVIEAAGDGDFAGQLPSDFPKGLPVPASSSVVAQSQGSVSFGTNDPAAIVERELEPALTRDGWRKTAPGRFTKNNRNVDISFSEADGRTTITYRY